VHVPPRYKRCDSQRNYARNRQRRSPEIRPPTHHDGIPSLPRVGPEARPRREGNTQRDRCRRPFTRAPEPWDPVSSSAGGRTIPTSRFRTARSDGVYEWCRCRTPDRQPDSICRTPNRPSPDVTAATGHEACQCTADPASEIVRLRVVVSPCVMECAIYLARHDHGRHTRSATLVSDSSRAALGNRMLFSRWTCSCRSRSNASSSWRHTR
jgi:hypothetical protein